ncbi:hypothetical protein CN090_21515 [Sinorhizobium meliloti]|uniref:Uncharacterized protein n=1 Tax=Rhizobium meliloti TaxID=382 RepID=A0AAW9TLH4_RHIML|nr:hypothetical protein [Sinorhizobium meliloti]MCM5690723.1 hypothetical protein [Sinorhizobium meliloti]MDE3788786.1 hypothetical protein [Sinorhizobium meliloti]MDE4596977.1 hypothetical protein [Sinorhizobium meliloti]MDW9614646.1 hypothetical protein [Sinorhizobium meliloti]MDW9837310.1 hypothetical protein [Sinorhizobium meliloti]
MGAAMTKINDLTGREQAFSAAARRFPQAEFTIRRLMTMSEDFYDLCGELAEAEDALARVPQSARQPEERQREWQELIDCLANEIGQALAEHGGWKPGPVSPG